MKIKHSARADLAELTTCGTGVTHDKNTHRGLLLRDYKGTHRSRILRLAYPYEARTTLGAVRVRVHEEPLYTPLSRRRMNAFLCDVRARDLDHYEHGRHVFTPTETVTEQDLPVLFPARPPCIVSVKGGKVSALWWESRKSIASETLRT